MQTDNLPKLLETSIASQTRSTQVGEYGLATLFDLFLQDTPIRPFHKYQTARSGF